MAKKFYAQKDALGFPIPGTMMSGDKVPSNLLEIPSQNVTPGEGETVVPHPNKLRYFIRRDAQGKIIPNSLVISTQRPSGLVYEFKLVK